MVREAYDPPQAVAEGGVQGGVNVVAGEHCLPNICSTTSSTETTADVSEHGPQCDSFHRQSAPPSLVCLCSGVTS